MISSCRPLGLELCDFIHMKCPVRFAFAREWTFRVRLSAMIALFPFNPFQNLVSRPRFRLFCQPDGAGECGVGLGQFPKRCAADPQHLAQFGTTEEQLGMIFLLVHSAGARSWRPDHLSRDQLAQVVGRSQSLFRGGVVNPFFLANSKRSCYAYASSLATRSRGWTALL